MNFKQPKFWRKSSKLNIFLWLNLPFSLIFFLISEIRKNIKKPSKLPAITITIGNAVIGGAGKTPTAIKIKEITDLLGFKSCFLARGYKGTLVGPEFINAKYNVAETGDEARLLMQYGEVCIAKNRSLAAAILAQRNYDLIILDDGYQNLSIKHDLKILVIDAKYNMGNGFLIPAGPLRQTISSALTEAHIIIYIGSTNSSVPEFLQNYQKIIIYGYYKAQTQLDKTQNYLAFSGLANNQKFFQLMKEQKYNICMTQEFPDHYIYQENDIAKLVNLAQKNNLNLVTTSKDYVKIADKYKNKISEFAIKLEIKKEKDFEKLIYDQIKKNSA